MNIATLIFYAVASFTLGAITYLLAIPIAVLSRLSDPTGGLADIISYAGVGVMFVGPIVFLAAVVDERRRQP